MTKAKGNGEEVTKAVMGDRVTKAAIKHSGVEPPPSRVKAERTAAARISDETSLRTSGQRKINLIWEATQAVVTVLVVSSTLYIAGSLVLSSTSDNSDRGAAFLLLSNAFFMIVTAYYQRTNHVRTGGVGGRNVDTDR